MTDLTGGATPILSPCVSTCAIHPVTGLCTGCQRSRREIAAWSRLSDVERVEIMRALPGRVR